LGRLPASHSLPPLTPRARPEIRQGMAGLFEDDATEDGPNPSPDGPGLFGDALPAAPLVEAPLVEVALAEAPGHAAAYRVLARKYRPVTLSRRYSDRAGGDGAHSAQRLFHRTGRACLHADRAFRGVGKTTTARIIARALNCTGPDDTGGPTADPCGVCGNCLAILNEREPDVFEMDAASRTGVDDVREIIEVSRSRPMKIRTKVFIIDEVHMLTRNAFNALLKTLEEPPPHVKFIFATTEIRKVPITVLSRCQRFDLRRVRVSELHGLFARIAEKEGVAIDSAAVGPDRAGRRRLGPRRAVDARPGDRPGGRRNLRRAGLRHAGAGRPGRGVRPDGGGDGRQARRRAWRSPTAPTNAAPISAPCCRICWNCCTPSPG